VVKYFTTMRIFILYTILLPFCIYSVSAQPSAQPILRIEDGMHTVGPGRMATDAAGKYLLTATDDKTARLWNASDGQLLNIFRIPIGTGEEGKLKACALSPDGSIAALGGFTGYQWDASYCVYIVNTQNGTIIQRISGLQKRICDLEFSPDGKWLAAAMAAGAGVNIYEVATWRMTKNLDGYTDDVNKLAFNKNNLLVTLSLDGFFKMYNKHFRYIEYGTRRTSSTQIPISLAFNPSGDILAVGYNGGYGDDIEIRSGKDLGYLYLASGDPRALAFTRNGQELYTGGLTPAFDSMEETKSGIRILNGDPLKSDSLLPVMKSEILGIKMLPNGNIAVLGFYPELAMLSPRGKLLWSKAPNRNDFISLHINNAGTAIGLVTRLHKSDTLKFDIKLRALVKGISYDYGETRSDDFHNSVDIERAVTPILEKHEAPLWYIVNDAGETIWGTDKYLCKFSGYSYGKPKLAWKTPLPSETVKIRASKNGKTVVVILADGTIRWYNVSDGKELLAFDIDGDKRRWILYTPSGYYDASPGAEDMLGWHINNGAGEAASFFPVSRFKQQYYRPDIIDAILETYDEEKAIAMANSGGRKTVADKISIKEKLPPVITINAPANGDTVTNAMVKLTYSIKAPDDAKAKNIKVLVNGRPVSVEKNIKPVQGNNYEISVKIPAADCKVTLLAENDNGTSPEANLYLKYRSPDKPKEDKPKEVFIKKPRLYILAIGISEYQNADYKLNYAATDANGFITEISKQKGNLYEDVVIKKLVDKGATKESIEDGLQWIQDQTLQQDIAMIFYAGHGVNDNNGIFYMLPVGADINRLRSTCVNFEELKQTVSNIAGKVVVFIDACHSGNVMGGSNRRNPGDINSVVNELSSTQNGAVTFTSSTGKEYSLEDPSWKHGAFTLALLEGLSGKAAVPGKNKITVKSLDIYISERVKELTKGKQHPTSVVPPNVPDFPIAAWQ